MKMPNPNPVVLCTKLAPVASRNMYKVVISILLLQSGSEFNEFYANFGKNDHI